MRKVSVIAIGAALTLALAGCAAPAPSSSAASSSEPASSSVEVSSSASSSASSQVVTSVKWTEVETAAEAAEGAGFERFGVMETVTLDEQEYKDPSFAYAEGVAQATYEQGATALIVRMADGKHTTPLTDRDKTEFAQRWTKSYESCDVNLYGSAKGAATVFTWVDGTKEFGVTFQGLGGEEVSLDSDEVAAIVKGFKEANATAEPKSEETTTNTTENQVVVPNVIGMTAADAAATIQAAGLTPDGGAEGTVVAQEPNAGMALDPGDTVSIVTEGAYSSDLIEVPNVIGMTAADAAATIQAAGLTPDGGGEGSVVEQMPIAGTLIGAGETVSIKASDSGNDPEYEGMIEVPNIVGMSAADAGAAIESMGLTPDGSAEGTVVEQTPAPGTMLDPGESVSFRTE